MTARPPRPVGRLAVLPVVAGAGMALLVPAASVGAALVAVLSCALWALSPRGRFLLPAGALKPAWALFPVAAFVAVAAAMPGKGDEAGAFASVVLAAQALLLLGPPTSWSLPAAVGGSVLVAAAVVLRIDDRRLVGPVLGYVAALLAGFAALESGAVTADDDRREPGTRRVAAPRGRRRSALPLAGLAALCLLGLPLGMTLSAALPQAEPPDDELVRPVRPDARSERPAGSGGRPATPRAGDGPDRRTAGEEFHSGARTRMRLGFVDTVKLDARPALVVRVEGEAPDAPLLMRGLSYDDFDGREWARSPDVEREVATSEPGRWLDVSPDPSGVALVRLVVTDVRGQEAGHLFLRAEPERVRLDATSKDVRLRATADATVYATSGLAPGAGYLEDARDPRPSVERVAAATSRPETVPFPRCAAAPPDARALLRLAKEAVGDETRPAARAVRIAQWLDARCTYVLSAPELRGAKRPVVEFLTNARRGSCEYFASAETLMLRALGHPARMTVGYRGGDRMADGTWSFRGTHAHAWTELWLDDVGWLPIDATPPDRRAADAQGPDEAEGELSGWARFRRVLHALLGGSVRLLPWALGVVLVFAILMRRVGGGAAAWPGGPAARAPKGPYARVLAAMRSAGLGRRDPWTPREFARVAGPSVPPAQEALASLTRGFERERYGGIAPDPTERARMEREADEVVSAAKRRRRDGGRARGGGSRRGGAPAGDSPTTEE